jgi:hypothetical protein
MCLPEVRETVNRYLLVLLRKKLTLAISDTRPTEILQVDSSTYRDLGHGDLTGFYDWLRKPNGELVGVCYSPLREIAFPFGTVARFSYVKVPSSPTYLEIYFGPDRAYDPKISDTQDFGDNWVYRSAEGELAISFDMHWLNEADFDRLQHFPVNWVTVP